MSCEFWVGVAQSAIGSGLGFLLGIGAYHYQQKKQSDKKEKENWRAAVDALSRLSMAAGANAEAICNSKLQFVSGLSPEVEKMSEATDEIYELPPDKRAKKTGELNTLSETMRTFYMSFPKTSVMSPPDVREYSSLTVDMPALPLFVHRARDFTLEINERIASRNALIAEHAREGGTGDGMSAERLMYFSRMLAGEGRAICMQTDDALDFWQLVLDQVNAYMKAKAKGVRFVEYKLVPKAKEAMPKEELFPLMRKQLVQFCN